MTDRPVYPWDLYPPLTPERLRVLARIIREVHHEVALRAEPSKGDNIWNLRADAYQRTRYALSRAAAGEHGEWLAVAGGAEQFGFAVGGVSLRLFEDDMRDAVGPRRSAEVVRQLALPLPELVGEGSALRVAVETDELGEATGVTLLEVGDAGVARHSWPIPLAAEPGDPSVVEFRRQPVGVMLPPPRIGVRRARRETGQPGRE